MNVHVLTRYAGQYTIFAMPDDQWRNLRADFQTGVSRTLTFDQGGVTVELLRNQVIGIELEPEGG